VSQGLLSGPEVLLKASCERYKVLALLMPHSLFLISERTEEFSLVGIRKIPLTYLLGVEQRFFVLL
jgi:hypothetical protein